MLTQSFEGKIKQFYNRKTSIIKAIAQNTEAYEHAEKNKTTTTKETVAGLDTKQSVLCKPYLIVINFSNIKKNII